jgi:hypothetical protein
MKSRSEASSFIYKIPFTFISLLSLSSIPLPSSFLLLLHFKTIYINISQYMSLQEYDKNISDVRPYVITNKYKT